MDAGVLQAIVEETALGCRLSVVGIGRWLRSRIRRQVVVIPNRFSGEEPAVFRERNCRFLGPEGPRNDKDKTKGACLRTRL